MSLKWTRVLLDIFLVLYKEIYGERSSMPFKFLSVLKSNFVFNSDNIKHHFTLQAKLSSQYFFFKIILI